MNITVTKTLTVPSGIFSFDPAADDITCSVCEKVQRREYDGDRPHSTCPSTDSFISKFIQEHTECVFTYLRQRQ